MLHDKEVDNTGHFLNNETIFSAVTVTTVYKAFSLSILKLHFHVYIIRPFILCDKNISNSVSNQNFIKISCSKFQRIGIYFSKNKGKYICRCLILQIYEFVLESLIQSRMIMAYRIFQQILIGVWNCEEFCKYCTRLQEIFGVLLISYNFLFVFMVQKFWKLG